MMDLKPYRKEVAPGWIVLPLAFTWLPWMVGVLMLSYLLLGPLGWRGWPGWVAFGITMSVGHLSWFLFQTSAMQLLRVRREWHFHLRADRWHKVKVSEPITVKRSWHEYVVSVDGSEKARQRGKGPHRLVSTLGPIVMRSCREATALSKRTRLALDRSRRLGRAGEARTT